MNIEQKESEEDSFLHKRNKEWEVRLCVIIDWAETMGVELTVDILKNMEQIEFNITEQWAVGKKKDIPTFLWKYRIV